MKKLLVVSAVLLLAAALYLAPAQARVQVGAGGEFGLNISTAVASPTDFQDKKSRNGIMFGGILNLSFSNWISLQPELRYSMKGMNQEGVDAQNNNTAYKWTHAADYLELPIYFKLSIPTGTLFTPHFMFGPVLGIKVSNSSKLTYGGQNIQLAPQYQDKVKSMDFGLGFGGGGRIALGPGDLFLNLLYDLGLSNTDDSPGSTGSIKSRCLTFATGYIFNFKTHAAAPATHRRTHG
jgi:hypothetical protein